MKAEYGPLWGAPQVTERQQHGGAEEESLLRTIPACLPSPPPAGEELPLAEDGGWPPRPSPRTGGLPAWAPRSPHTPGSNA